LSYEEAFAAREARLRSPTGWLSLVGKIFLGEGATPIELPDGSRPGTIHREGRIVRFEPAPGEAIEGRVLESDRDGPADALHVRGFTLEVMERGDTFALRIRAPRGLPFNGIDRYPIDPKWIIDARLEPHIRGDLDLAIDFEGSITSDFRSPGVVIFEHGGSEHRLLAVYEDASRRRLFLLFRDATSGTESYPLGRFVYAPVPDAEGRLVIDFNLAMLPGCAFTEFATCPIPPRENRLSIPVRAGERSVC
jgi:uncharacterized protein (DUF1684 family)